jgi:protein-tyrosine-phosphatase
MHFGLDLEGHVSHEIDWGAIVEAELVLTMMRRHVRELVVREPSLWRRTFTLRELVRRGQVIGPRPASVSVAVWIEAAQEGRAVHELLGEDPADDVADPMGGGQDRFDEMAQTLFTLTNELVELLWPSEVG